jgi:predicted transcriptional regulator
MPEKQDMDLKSLLMMMMENFKKKIQENTCKQLEALKEETKKSFRELKENTTKQVMELNKTIQDLKMEK